MVDDMIYRLKVVVCVVVVYAKLYINLNIYAMYGKLRNYLVVVVVAHMLYIYTVVSGIYSIFVCVCVCVCVRKII